MWPQQGLGNARMQELDAARTFGRRSIAPVGHRSISIIITIIVINAISCWNFPGFHVWRLSARYEGLRNDHRLRRHRSQTFSVDQQLAPKLIRRDSPNTILHHYRIDELRWKCRHLAQSGWRQFYLSQFHARQSAARLTCSKARIRTDRLWMFA